MNKTALGVSALFANLVLALVGRGSMYQLITFFMLIEFIALPVIVIGLLAYIFRHKWQWGSAVARACGSIVFVVASTVVSFVPGRMLLKSDIAAAKGHCESLVPKLDAFRVTHGAYPSSIGELPNQEPLPRLLKGSEFYHSEGAAFSFSFGDPSGMLNGFAFDSQSKKWSKWD